MIYWTFFNFFFEKTQKVSMSCVVEWDGIEWDCFLLLQSLKWPLGKNGHAATLPVQTCSSDTRCILIFFISHPEPCANLHQLKV